MGGRLVSRSPKWDQDCVLNCRAAFYSSSNSSRLSPGTQATQLTYIWMSHPDASGLGILTNHLVAGGLWAQVAMLLWQVDGGVNHLNEGCIFCHHSDQVLWQRRSMLPQFIYFLIIMIKLSPTLVWHSSSPSTAEQPDPQSKRGNRSQVVS